MQKGIQITFSNSEGPAVVEFDKTRSGFNTVTQNGLVNLATHRGTDPLVPLKGTELFSEAVVGSLIDKSERDHALAFAAEQTRLFLRNQEIEQNITDPSEKINKVGLELLNIDFNKLEFNAFFVNTNGQTVGSPLSKIL